MRPVQTQSTSAARYVLTAEIGHVFVPLVKRLAREAEVRSICDLSGGANPVLALDDVGFVDDEIAQAQLLDKAPGGYEARRLDIGNASFDLKGERFDLVVSHFVAEHVADPVLFHSSAGALLRPCGRAAHFFPTLPSTPSVVNPLLMEPGSRRMLNLLQPRIRHERGQRGKFRAYYRWCEGPTRRQYRRFASVGFSVEDYVVLVGHDYSLLPGLQRSDDFVSRQLIRRPWPGLSTYSAVVLRRRP